MQKTIFRFDFEQTRDLNLLENIFKEYDGIQLYAKNLDSFRREFNKYALILYAYSHKICSLYAPINGAIFEDTVMILSEIEDRLDIEIKQVSVDSLNYRDIALLKEFYFDDLKDGSISLEIVYNEVIGDFDILSGVLFAGSDSGITIGLNTCISFNFEGINKYFKSLDSFVSSFYASSTTLYMFVHKYTEKNIVVYGYI